MRADGAWRRVESSAGNVFAAFRLFLHVDLTLGPGLSRLLAAVVEGLRQKPATDQQRGMVRHAAFELARKAVADPEATAVIGWLEGVLKVVAPVQSATPATPATASGASVCFAPGEACLSHIVRQLGAARQRHRNRS